jgi:peptidoglycan/xylan/chitin deacetylase (PgdA/CDA1 family)
MTRRSFVGALAAASQAQSAPARVAITFDLEMSRNFPTWETTHWDYEKGNLDADTKRYTSEGARLVAARGGRMHFFAVGRVLEQENIAWLEEIVRAGHAVGNHTYDHVFVMATKPEEVQFRFRRAPWLMRGQAPAAVIEENVRLCTEAMKTRLGVTPNGFRTPGGFAQGLSGRADVQRMLLRQGFQWLSGKYPRHPIDIADPAKYLPAALRDGQPFAYPETGLIEIPMSPVSDINAFRSGRWPLARFLDAIRFGVEWTIEHRAVFDFLGHPSCLLVADPKMQVLDTICDVVEKAGPRAELVTLDRVGRAVPPSKA